MASIKKSFVDDTRQLARAFVDASDRFNAKVAEWQYSTATEPDELTPAGELVNLEDNPNLAAQVQAFYEALGGLLAPLSDDDKKAIYALL